MTCLPRALLVFITPLLLAGCCTAQQSGGGDQSYFGAIFTEEEANIKAGCQDKDVTGTKPLKDVVTGCLESLFHGNKGLYGSFANLPPGNGVALGAAFKDSELNLTHWRLNYQVDAQGSFNGSWTAGGLLTMKLSPAESDKKRKSQSPVIVVGPVPKKLPDLGENETKLLINIYAFHTSLNQVSYYGIGPGTSLTDRAFFGMRETITGANADRLLKYGFHLLGEINGRWPEVVGDHGQSSPSIEQIYSESTAPGLTRQPGFLQFGEGLQYASHFGGLGEKANFGMNADLDYGVNFQQFVAPSDSEFSFRRLTVDVTNDFHLLKRFTPRTGSSTSEQFGTLELRGWLAESAIPAGHLVPFYFQPTLGGGDIDKQRTLASFADYRFRAPNALLLRAQYEQPLPKISFLGVTFRADAGKVANSRGDIDLSHLRHSFGAGVTLRAGNFPYVTVMYAWAGGEGHHTFADLNLSAISPGGGAASIW
jgi:hypothetical protein